MSFIHCFKAEWIKKKNSLASWLVIIGGLFTPTIMIAIYLYRASATRIALTNTNFWDKHWLNSWESIATFLLPMGIILSTSLVAQIEYKNNTWKQIHTSPQSFANLFLAKLGVIVVMLFQFFLIFNIATYFSGVIPALCIKNAAYPTALIPFKTIVNTTGKYFLTSLPIIALQFLISLKYKNFLIPVGVGIGIWIASIAGLPWKYSCYLPYSHSSLNYLKESGRITRELPIFEIAVIYFIGFTVLSYVLYITKKEKG